MPNAVATLVALLAASSLALRVHADVVVKDTLDPANFIAIGGGGGIIEQVPNVINQIDHRTYIGFLPHQRGLIGNLTFNFVAIAQGTGSPLVQPGRENLFDLHVAAYPDIEQARSEPRRTDVFLPEGSQPADIFTNPVGVAAGLVFWPGATVFQASYDLQPFGLSLNPNEVNFVGLSSTGVPAGITYQIQRSNDAGVVVGSEADYVFGSAIPLDFQPMSDFYADAIQNSVRITITNFGDARDGDFNGDAFVNGLDFLVWQRAVGTGDLVADGDVDGDVDHDDLLVWETYYGQSAPTSAPASSLTVPEPTSIALVAFAFGMAVVRRVRQ